MPDDSNGIYSVPAGTIVTTGDPILPSQHNPWANDSASAISNRFSKDGRAPATGNWNLNNFKITNLGAPTNNGDAVNKSYADSVVPPNGSVTTPKLAPTIVSGLTAKTTAVDADTFFIGDSAASEAPKKITLANIVPSVFTTSRTIPNAQFSSASFKLFNAAGTPRALGFDTTALTADRNITFPDADINLNTGLVNRIVSSGQFTPSAGAGYVFAHGRGVAPKRAWAVGVCLTAEFGWSVGDEIELRWENTLWGSTASNSTGVVVWASSTSINGRQGDSTSFQALLNKSSGAGLNLTYANWRVILRAEF